MAAVIVRSLDDRVRDRLRIRAAANKRSMEAEIRAILADAVRDPDDAHSLLNAVFDQFSALGGVELDLPQRSTAIRAADLSE